MHTRNAGTSITAPVDTSLPVTGSGAKGTEMQPGLHQCYRTDSASVMHTDPTSCCVASGSPSIVAALRDSETTPTGHVMK